MCNSAMCSAPHPALDIRVFLIAEDVPELVENFEATANS